MAGPIDNLISLHPRHVLLEVEGYPLSPDEIAEALSAAVDVAIRAELDLVIRRQIPVKQRASTTDFFHFASWLSRSGFTRKIALVFPEEMHADNLDFFVTAATNRGMRVSVFAETDAALEWIQGGRDGESP